MFLEPARRGPRLLGGALGQGAENLRLNAAPIDVAEYLRRRLFGSDTSDHHDERDAGVQSRSRPGTSRGSAQAIETGLELLSPNAGRAREVRRASFRSARRSITSGR